MRESAAKDADARTVISVLLLPVIEPHVSPAVSPLRIWYQFTPLAVPVPVWE